MLETVIHLGKDQAAKRKKEIISKQFFLYRWAREEEDMSASVEDSATKEKRRKKIYKNNI